ncbi:MAG: hypothetical protein U0324_36520 [Polyangiales bacterium]
MRRLLLLTALAAACAAGEEATVEAGAPDLPGADAEAEAAVDAKADAADDVALDDLATQPDAPVDVAPDALPDALPDAAPDAAFDARADADAAADAPADVMDASIPPDAGPLADGLPVDAVMYFTGTACPRGWIAYTEGVGRVAVPTPSVTLLGVQRGAPLADGEDRAHGHTLSGSFAVPGVSYAGIAGCCNNGLGAAATLPFMAPAREASSGLPYVQLLVCRKTGPSRAALLPSGMLVYFAAARCPTGFTRAEDPRGHLPVGTPAGGLHGARFGTTPPGIGETRAHRHAATPTLATVAQGIALASGCCAGDYAAHGEHRGTWNTSDAESGPPTVQLLLCQAD